MKTIYWARPKDADSSQLVDGTVVYTTLEEAKREAAKTDGVVYAGKLTDPWQA